MDHVGTRVPLAADDDVDVTGPDGGDERDELLGGDVTIRVDEAEVTAPTLTEAHPQRLTLARVLDVDASHPPVAHRFERRRARIGRAVVDG